MAERSPTHTSSLRSSNFKLDASLCMAEWARAPSNIPWVLIDKSRRIYQTNLGVIHHIFIPQISVAQITVSFSARLSYERIDTDRVLMKRKWDVRRWLYTAGITEEELMVLEGLSRVVSANESPIMIPPGRNIGMTWTVRTWPVTTRFSILH